MKFEEIGFEDAFVEGLETMNFKEMTQSRTGNPCNYGRSGYNSLRSDRNWKTTAYLLPVLNRMLKNPRI